MFLVQYMSCHFGLSTGLTAHFRLLGKIMMICARDCHVLDPMVSLKHVGLNLKSKKWIRWCGGGSEGQARAWCL